MLCQHYLFPLPIFYKNCQIWSIIITEFIIDDIVNVRLIQQHDTILKLLIKLIIININDNFTYKISVMNDEWLAELLRNEETYRREKLYKIYTLGTKYWMINTNNPDGVIEERKEKYKDIYEIIKFDCKFVYSICYNLLGLRKYINNFQCCTNIRLDQQLDRLSDNLRQYEIYNNIFIILNDGDFDLINDDIINICANLCEYRSEKYKNEFIKYYKNNIPQFYQFFLSCLRNTIDINWYTIIEINSLISKINLKYMHYRFNY